MKKNYKSLIIIKILIIHVLFFLVIFNGDEVYQEGGLILLKIKQKMEILRMEKKLNLILN